MKRKLNMEYSKTSKQRKEQQKKGTPPPPPTPEELAAQEELKAKKAAKRKKAGRISLLIAACVVAVCLIATAIAIPIIAADRVKGNPIAKITLNDGSVIKMELYIDDEPAAVANFIYLAKSGFYDGTIFHDTSTKGLLSFGGYTDLTTNRADDENFIKTLKGFEEHKANAVGSNYKLGYRIRRTNTNVNLNNKKGSLVMLGGSSTFGTSTHFVITSGDNPQTTYPGNSSSITSNIIIIGRYMDQQSLDVIDRLAQMETVDKAVINSFRPPKDYRSVAIKSISISNLKRSLKRKITNDFENYMKNLDVISWVSKSYSYSSTAINPGGVE